MAWYVDTDGKTIRKYTCTLHGIRLDDGREYTEEEIPGMMLAVHPDENNNITKVDGVYHMHGESLQRDN